MLRLGRDEAILFAGRKTGQVPERQQSLQQMVNRLKINTANLNREVGGLSGGIQQKVALGHWLSLKPLVVILDQPTPEIDTEGKKEICDLIADLKLTFTVSVKGGMDESI